ncbi:MAG: glycoside hydrolase family 25 [Beijerinckiaceae bacterium]|nr:glycoside hydrolase family 25 [Beijerinckiaceae bacterium]
MISACALLALVACAGSDDFLEPAEPNGHHPFPERSSTTGRNAHGVHGIDIAKYQGDIDWNAVKASGIAFAFIKATEGTDLLDEKFAQNWAAAKAAGLPRGAYHFNYWCSSFKDQFEWFRRNVPRDKDALPPVLDLEWNTHSPTCPRKVSRTRAKQEIRAFVQLAEAWYGKRPILYTDIRFYRDVLSDGSFSQYPLWVRATRRLPQDIYKGRKWVFWQYSDRSRVPGIRGRVDKNAFAGSQREWNALIATQFGTGRVVAPSAVKPAAKSVQKPADVGPGVSADTRSRAVQGEIVKPISANTDGPTIAIGPVTAADAPAVPTPSAGPVIQQDKPPVLAGSVKPQASPAAGNDSAQSGTLKSMDLRTNKPAVAGR